MEEVKQELKVGDKVRCINGQSVNGRQIQPGYVGVVTHVSWHGSIAIDNLLGSDNVTVCWPSAFELIKEEKQMKATDKVNVEITLSELAKVYAVLGKCSGRKTSDLYSLAQKMFDVENKRKDFMAGIEGGDVLKYHNYEDKFLKLMFPEPVEQKTPQQIQIDQLQETINKAAAQIKAIKEGV